MRVGGQAVIEGVMMRAGDRACVAVRRCDGSIATREVDVHRPAALLRVPFVRGVATLAESLRVGVAALRWSEQNSLAAEDPRQPAPVWVLLCIALSAVVAMVVAIPALLAGLAPAGSGWFAAIETGARLAVAGSYLALVARRRDVARVFEYHGAEHLVVGAWENGTPLEAGPLRGGDIRHPRCGTSFLLVVSGVAAVVHPLLPHEPVADRMLTRLLVVPVVAAISFELLTGLGRLAAIRPGGWVEAALVWPQRFTTRQPDAAQIEVAIVALRGALDVTDAPARAGASVLLGTG